jgi:hypothetical protein
MPTKNTTSDVPANETHCRRPETATPCFDQPSVSTPDIMMPHDAQQRLDRASASSGPLQVRITPVLVRPDLVPCLPTPELARNGDVVAMIVRHHAGAKDCVRMRREFVAFRHREGESFPSVLRGALRRQQKRRSGILLRGLFARQGPWSGSASGRAHVSILFKDALLHLENLGGENELMTVETCGRRGDTERDREERVKLRLSLGQSWLHELGYLGPPHRATALAQEIEPDPSD